MHQGNSNRNQVQTGTGGGAAGNGTRGKLKEKLRGPRARAVRTSHAPRPQTSSHQITSKAQHNSDKTDRQRGLRQREGVTGSHQNWRRGENKGRSGTEGKHEAYG